MTPKEKIVNLLEQVLAELKETINQWLAEKQIAGRIFYAPVETANGWQINASSPQEIVPNWLDTIDLVFGRNLENFKLLADLQAGLAGFYNSDSPPPRWSTTVDLLHEIKILLADFLGASLLIGRAVKFSNESHLIESAYEFLNRKSDTYHAKSPLFGLRLSQEINFNHGRLLPLDWNGRVNLFKKYSDKSSHSITGQIHTHILDAEALLVISFEKPREKNSTLLFPFELQILSDNAIQLLRVYDYGPVQELWTEMEVESITPRGCGTISRYGSFFAAKSDFYSVTDMVEIKSFLDKFLKKDRLDDGPLSFITTRLTEAWLRARTNDFKAFDYVSILEGLLVAANEGEFRFKVALLTATFSAINAAEKNEIFKLVRKAYDLRSKVAHCAKEITPKDQLTNEELQRLGKLTHPIIRYAFEHGPSKLKDDAMAKLLS